MTQPAKAPEWSGAAIRPLLSKLQVMSEVRLGDVIRFSYSFSGLSGIGTVINIAADDFGRPLFAVHVTANNLVVVILENFIGVEITGVR